MLNLYIMRSGVVNGMDILELGKRGKGKRGRKAEGGGQD
jgi:hypothetical protein